MNNKFEAVASAPRRRLVNVAALAPLFAIVHACGGGGGTGGTLPGDPGAAPVPPAPLPGGGTAWVLGQSAKRLWDFGAQGWAGGNAVTMAQVEAGATLVLVVWGFQSSASPQHIFPDPLDSLGQGINVVADAGHDARVPVQLKAWVLHNARAGDHSWSNLPDFTGGDGLLFFMEFRRAGVPSSRTLGAATITLNAARSPWLSAGSVTMSSGAAAGDLLVACSFEEELSVGKPVTTYTDPPSGWSSVGVQTASVDNIAGEVCWRVAPDSSQQNVAWSWSITGNQDPTIFQAIIFAVA